MLGGDAAQHGAHRLDRRRLVAAAERGDRDRPPRRTIALATLGCGYEAPAVEPMREVLRRVAAEHCFSCDARVR